MIELLPLNITTSIICTNCQIYYHGWKYLYLPFAIEYFGWADKFGLVIGREVCQLWAHTYLNFDIEHIGEMTPKSPFFNTQLSVVY
jgi:hypothetical protein